MYFTNHNQGPELSVVIKMNLKQFEWCHQHDGLGPNQLPTRSQLTMKGRKEELEPRELKRASKSQATLFFFITH